MNIRDIFRQRSDSIESLQRKYKSIASKKESLEKRADDLRAEALKSDSKDTQKKIDDIREEILLADVALTETKKELERALEKKIETDFQGLDAEKRKYENQTSDLSRKSGRSLGQTVKSLQSLNLSFARNLAEQIRQTVIDFDNDSRFKSQMADFLTAYSSEINSQAEVTDFKKWKNEIRSVERLKPGSQAAKNHVRGEIKDLLRAS